MRCHLRAPRRRSASAASASLAVLCTAFGVGGQSRDDAPVCAPICAPTWATDFGLAAIGSAQSLAVDDSGEAPIWYAGGNSGVARWSDGSWSLLGSGSIFEVRALALLSDADAGPQPAIFAGPEGGFLEEGPARGVVRWNGLRWTNVGGGLNPGALVQSMEVFDDGSGPALYVGGTFTHAGGIVAVNLARWDGAAWSSVGGLATGPVMAMAVVDFGAGGRLVVASSAITVGGVVTKLAAWDGRAWTPIEGAPANTQIRVMTGHDDGTGSSLYVAGQSGPDLTILPTVDRFDGTTWTTLGLGFNGSIGALASFDDGTGRKLYAGGDFSAVVVAGGTAPISRPAVWDGFLWSSIDPDTGVSSGVNGSLRAMRTARQADREALAIGGFFATAGGNPSMRVARLDGCPLDEPVVGDLDGDGVVDGADLAILLGAWGRCSRDIRCAADLDGDGSVGAADLAILLGAWEA